MYVYIQLKLHMIFLILKMSIDLVSENSSSFFRGVLLLCKIGIFKILNAFDNFWKVFMFFKAMLFSVFFLYFKIQV